MRSVSHRRTVVAAAVVGAAGLGWSSVGVSGAAPRAADVAAMPPQTVTGALITRPPHTLAPGTRVRSGDLAGQRVFTDAKHGFALASVGGADYAVATTDGAKTWKTDGPALHLDAAQAPLAVVYLGALSRKTVFAWGGGQVIDTTSDGGTKWYSTLFVDGGPVAVVPSLGTNDLVAFVGSFDGASLWQYVSKDGGRVWRYQTTVDS